MKACVRFVAKQLLTWLLCVSVAFAQTTLPDSAQPIYSQAELDQMLAPIALYPDSLLSQILMAATYPMEVVLAARWSRANPGLTGEQAVRAVEQYDWDPSVKSLVAFPQILDMMDQKLEWTQRLGDAFLAQQQQVMDTVQQLRAKAQAAGNLQSNEYVRVVPQQQVIIVEEVNPRVVYVPYYDPWFVYGTWWWPAYPPVYWRSWPGYYAAPGASVVYLWGAGITVGVGFFFGAFDWPHNHVTVVNVHNFYYRPRPPVAHVPQGHWAHDPGHRRGVPYRDPEVRERFRHEYGSPDARREYRGDETLRRRLPERPRVYREERNIRERVRPETRDSGRPEPREGRRESRESMPLEQRKAPDQPGARAAPERPSAVPEAPRVQRREVPVRPEVRSAPLRPKVESQPNMFEGVGRGNATREFSERGRASTRAAPPGPGVQRQHTAPAPQRGNVAPRERPSGKGRGDSGAQPLRR